LKLRAISLHYRWDLGLSALDPGKQGLKLSSGDSPKTITFLSALDPGKQGLKPRLESGRPITLETFSA